MNHYRVIAADPPWHFKLFSEKTGVGRAPQRHYQCLSLKEIKALPVREITDPEGCVLFLWATNPMLPAALDVMEAWGFTFVSKVEWVKLIKDGSKPTLGTGYRFRGSTEPLLFGVSGRKPYCPPQSSLLPGVIMSPRREHSRKPVEAYRYFEQYPGPRLEMFARESREGWHSIGNGMDGRDIREVLCEMADQKAMALEGGVTL